MTRHETAIVFSNLPEIIASGLTAVAANRGIRVLSSDEVISDIPFVQAIGMIGSSDHQWDLLTSEAAANRVGCVVVTDRYQARFFRRAYELGAAVAHLDSPVETVIDVITTRARGEILAPAALLASVITDRVALLPGEITVLKCLARGYTVARTAEVTYYSDRHVRRLLQSIMTKAGTSNRQEALEHFASELA